jgi:hypothetical protein
MLRLRMRGTDHTITMTTRVALIKQLVDDGSYPLDEAAIAEAIVVRSMARRVVPDIAFHRPPPKPPVRSFRHHSGARSFRLVRAQRRPSDRRMSAAFGAPSPA